MIDAYASMTHYAEHVLPVWRMLPHELRGTFYSQRPGSYWGTPYRPRSDDSDRPVLVASLLDAQRLKRRRLVYVEHGAGQAYPGDAASAGHGSYSGGKGLDRVELFLCPSERVAARWRAAYPDVDAVVVGCPKLDVAHLCRARQVEQVVVFAFHWDCGLIPETRSALRHYVSQLSDVAGRCVAAGAVPIGSGHPRAWRTLGPLWERTGVRTWPHSGQVLTRGSVLVADNTSLLFEFASTGRPVVVLNAPWYRRHVEHGLRFWSHVPGRQVDEPSELWPAIRRALHDPDDGSALRSAAVREAYGHVDGRAAQRAVAAIEARFA